MYINGPVFAMGPRVGTLESPPWMTPGVPIGLYIDLASTPPTLSFYNAQHQPVPILVQGAYSHAKKLINREPAMPMPEWISGKVHDTTLQHKQNTTATTHNDVAKDFYVTAVFSGVEEVRLKYCGRQPPPSVEQNE
eukprot:TRINITY_DN3690_c0_g1_i1.p4 TRINITY_DN3690_c0_g1~~TRINITY_DN3690_c0_g1_i1.p4  ORF type:complete len:136 (-),score=28.58 TRINITY_DN3690_c0_g1_i1:23-430(-)